MKRNRGVDKTSSWPILGCGVGLRNEHYDLIIREWPRMDWFEAVSENYMDTGGRPLRILEEVRRHYPVALHGVSLSIGSVDPLDQHYLERLKALVDRIEPAIVSDHLCWTKVDEEQLHDLLPLPFTEEAIRHVAQRVEAVQGFLGRRILIENISTYVTYKHSVMSEWEFLAEVARRADCGILLDLNNIYVNAVNHGFDPYLYLEHIPGERIGQFHLAGHTDMGTYLFDTHSRPIIDQVWNLYRRALQRYGSVTTLIEWDEDIPEFSELAKEAAKARAIYREFESRDEETPLRPVVREKSPESPRDNDRQNSEVTLADLQRWMKSKIQPVAKRTTSGKLIPSLNPQGGAPGLERMVVYSRGYIARIEEALAEMYEAVRHVLGHKRFHDIAERYAHEYPSRVYNLSSVGQHLPEFLPSLEITKDFPFLPDLAKLERLVSRTFHSFDQPPFDPAQFASLPLENWEGTRFIFQPSVNLISSPWPLLDIWNARAKPVEEINIDLVNRPQHVLVARIGLQVRCELLSERQYRLMEGLLAGKTLGLICEELAAGGDETLPLAEWFARWVRDGLIIRCEFSAEPAVHPSCGN